jgi:hypothetical protein
MDQDFDEHSRVFSTFKVIFFRTIACTLADVAARRPSASEVPASATSDLSTSSTPSFAASSQLPSSSGSQPVFQSPVPAPLSSLSSPTTLTTQEPSSQSPLASHPTSASSTLSIAEPSASTTNLELPSPSPSASQCRMHITETRFSTRPNVWNVSVYAKTGNVLIDKSPVCMTGADAPTNSKNLTVPCEPLGANIFNVGESNAEVESVIWGEKSWKVSDKQCMPVKPWAQTPDVSIVCSFRGLD